MSVSRSFISQRLAIAFFAVTLLLSACDSAEERAEAHFQAGMAHLDAGDVERALVEFRNVFKLNGQHKEARLTFARLERERGNVSIAYSQYLRLVEQYPDNFEGQRSLAEMALEVGNWEDVRRHGAVAVALAPDDIGIKSVNNTLAYVDAVRDGDAAGVDSTVHTAREMVRAHPDLMTARQVVIDHLVRNQDWDGVLDETTTALAIAPKQEGLYSIRLRALQELDQPDKIEEMLNQMAQIFPDDKGVEQFLVQHHINQGNLDAAEQLLRTEVDPQAEDFLPTQRLVAFLSEYRNTAAAIAELDTIIAQNGPNSSRLKTVRAKLKFGAGETQTAIAEMQDLINDAERTMQIRESEVEFARMLFQIGRTDDAKTLIENVLSEDATQVEALKLKASWLIGEDNTGDAIVQLRKALDQTPRDPQLMTLMAYAHEQNGDWALTGEMLALATEMSRRAPEETLRYARFLIAEGDLEIAEHILTASLYQNPEQSELLFLLGEVYLKTQDWDRARAVQRTIGDIGTPQARRKAKELKAHMLAAQDRADDLTEFLNELADDPEFGLSADIALIRSLLARGESAAAFARLDQMLEEAPDSLPVRMVKAHALADEGNSGEAERLYRAILADYPGTTRAWVGLYALLNGQKAPEKAQQVLVDALAVLPESPDILMLQAMDHERAGELDQAIAVYDKLYPLSNRSVIVANNLASLLTTHRNDGESLQRAGALARRLRGTREPVFQETYGWVAYRLGNYDEAVTYLEAAARTFSDHPLVLYHLGKAYVAVDRPDDAMRVYRAAQATGVPLSVSPTLEDEIEQLNAANIAGQ